MSCMNLEYRMDTLRRCGCHRCEEEYYHMRSERYRGDRYAQYYPSPLPYGNASAPAIMLAPVTSTTSKETKMEEPKNIAVKILVEKLKSEQKALQSNSASLKTYEDPAKTYREAKNMNLKAIKELGTALKKLGHKDTPDA